MLRNTTKNVQVITGAPGENQVSRDEFPVERLEIDWMQQRWSGFVTATGGIEQDLLRVETCTHLGPKLVSAEIFPILQDRQGTDAYDDFNQSGDPPA
jgi:hypothetical protein